ncbi:MULTISPECIES: hypothetical protein [unclassified Streptomyces]|uniref:hypothetical protein n=1 Tax=unclassified Streptomyces TaxID=2593676 RepID=UPI0009404A24|nr:MULTISPECIES: hypothetical protein [unclassified Streptomyces]MBT2425821.1 hypothetical protein [Streptomyces sp. ISL-112]MBT2460804.1 hypothetical protein [Streptomyces sp. ISL-63]
MPDHVLAPLAVEAERGWYLMPDGGPLFRQVLDEGAGTLADWEDARGAETAHWLRELHAEPPM